MTIPYFDDYLPDTQKIGRMVPNAFGIDEVIALSVKHWKHFDWLSSQGVDMSLWTKEADICRHQDGYKSYWNNALTKMLCIDEERRYFANLECPLFINGKSYEEPSKGAPENVEIVERLKTDNEYIQRNYIGAIGVSIPISMHGKYWRFLDWLCEYDGEKLAQEWVTFADFEKNSQKQSVGEKLETLLLKREEKIYLDYDGDASLEIPLFICPMGHLDVRPLNMSTRELENSKGLTLPIRMSAQSWKQYEWLGSIGIDMKKFVKDIDINRRKSKPIGALYMELILALRSECEMRLKG